jgi:ribonuclease HI
MDNVGFSELVLCAGWYIWWERRQKVHNEEIQTPFRSATSIVLITKNYMMAAKKPQRRKEVTWSKPLEGMLKINVDVAFDIQSGRGAGGVVIRDYRGQCIAASQKFLPYVVDTPMAEAYALREGLVLAQHIGINNFVLQTDCTQVVETMRDDGFCATAATAIYDDCKIMWSGFDRVEVEHCHREANPVAHEFARVSFESTNSCIWVDEPPSFIISKLVNDVTVL